MKRFQEIIFNPRFIIILFIGLSVLASLQSYLPGRSYFELTGYYYTQYNNYNIFSQSFHNLVNGTDLYILYPEKHWDLYKYTPTFSLFFGFFTLFPDWAGLILWSLLNSLIFLAAVYYLPHIDRKKKLIILLIIAIEMMTSLQNEQSNALITGLLIFSMGFLEKDKPLLASLSIIISVYIKLFGIVGFLLFIFYPKKLKLALLSLMWAVILFSLPLIVIDLEQYGNLINSYINMLGADHSESVGYSVMGWLRNWFCIFIDKAYILSVGTLLLFLPLFKIKSYQYYYYRLLALCSVLIWIVIFNHKAESPTFIIAMAGVAIWFVISPKNILNVSLFVFAMIFTSLSPTDLFPDVFFDEFVHPLKLKAVPCIIIWFKILFDMLWYKDEKYLKQTL